MVSLSAWGQWDGWYESDWGYSARMTNPKERMLTNSSRGRQFRRAAAKALRERWVEKRSRKINLNEVRRDAAVDAVEEASWSLRLLSDQEVHQSWELLTSKVVEKATRALQEPTAVALKALHLLNVAVQSLDVDTLNAAIEQAIEAGVPLVWVATAQNFCNRLEALTAAIRSPEQAQLQRAIDQAMASRVPEADTRVQVAKSMLEAMKSKDLVSLAKAFVRCAQHTVNSMGPYGPCGTWSYFNRGGYFQYYISDGGLGKLIFKEPKADGYNPEGVLVQSGEGYEGEIVCSVYGTPFGKIRVCYNSKDDSMTSEFWQETQAHSVAPLKLVATRVPAPGQIMVAASVITSELACAFIQRGYRMIEDGCVEADNMEDNGVHVVYHWTPEKNFPAILAHGLQVPGAGSGVAHQTDTGFYGRGIYTSNLFEHYRRYGKGAQESILCLCLPGRQFPAHYPAEFGMDLRTGYDSHISADSNDGPVGSQWIMFSSDQLLPLFLVDKRTRLGCDLIANNLIKFAAEQITRVGRGLLRLKRRSLETLLKDVLQAFRKDPLKIARWWPKLMMRSLRVEHSNKTTAIRRRIMRKRQEAEDWESWEPWWEWEHYAEQAQHWTENRIPSKGVPNVSKPRRVEEQGVARRNAPKRRQWQRIDKAKSRDAKMGEFHL